MTVETRPDPVWPELAIPCTALSGIGPARQRELAAAGLDTVERLLRHLPFRYEDRSAITPLAQVRAPGRYTLAGCIRSVRARRTGRRHVLRAELQDDTGTLEVIWFNQPYMERTVRPGARLLLSGEVAADRQGRPLFRAPEVQGTGNAPQPPGWVPVYRLPRGIRRHTLRQAVRAAAAGYAARIPDPLPETAGLPADMLPAAQAWTQMHLPQSKARLEAARRTLVLHELVALHTGLLLRRGARRQRARPPLPADAGDLAGRFQAGLPFVLTAAQRRVLAEIERDLEGPLAMYRLVQGDVGAGKTVVAAAAALRAIGAGGQAALMVPSTVLAEQHHRTLRRLCGALCPVELLTGSTPAAARRALRASLEAGRPQLVVGTHALLDPEVRFAALRLAIIDEQHRFGVRQRDALAAKGAPADVLVLTATPIPRTLVMTLYGDMDVSRLDALPPGRGGTRTYLRAPHGRRRVYTFVRSEVEAGRQAFVVCPFISNGDAEEGEHGWDEPDALPAGGGRASAEAWAARLAAFFPEGAVGLVHGDLPPAQRTAVMERFAAGELGVLVATTVVEVGVDVPNATVMVVEDADRFGLAQLHQLRGRVGRGAHPGYCILITQGAPERLRALTELADGFAVAEADLAQRGPGEVMGTRQHGLPGLALARPDRDMDLWRAARRISAEILAQDPGLRAPAHQVLRRHVVALTGTLEGDPDWSSLSGFMPNV